MTKLQHALRRNWGLYLMLVPAIVYLIVFHYFPMYGVTIAFKDFSARLGIMGSPWVGLKHFTRVFTSPNFLPIVGNTLVLSFYQLVVTFPLPILLALMINSCFSKRLGTVLKNITYAPYFISVVVLVGMMFIMFAPRGVFNQILVFFGAQPRLFMGEEQYFRHMFVFSNVWQTTGWSSIIYMAALSGVSPELHEAAVVDGASKLRRVISIDLPMIVPTAAIILTLNVGGVMSLGFEKAYLMQTPLNIEIAEILSTYVYKKGLLDIDYSYAAAVGLFNNVINLVLLSAVNWFSRRITKSSLW
ncbi:ABC transporter permease subunit [Ruminococcaceae bacterium OttesenSCG-928-L11]|nr:ABC transporter permease subunit [Ruminococcaceae bacterium OttesenSCG-928-L11]